MAASSSANCFDYAYQACKIALENMTPVILLTDTYLANGTGLWRIPKSSELPDIHPQGVPEALKGHYNPALRDERGVRYWAYPGMEGYEHRNIGTMTRNLDYGAMDRLTQDIMQAGEVLVLASSGAAPYGIYLTRMLNLLGIKAYTLNPSENLTSFLSSHDRSVLVISFGIARYSKQGVLQLRNLRQRGYHIVSFTDRHDSPYVDLSDYYFFMPVNCFDFLDSYTAGLTLINTLLSNIGLQDERRLSAQLRAHDLSLEGMDWLF